MSERAPTKKRTASLGIGYGSVKGALTCWIPFCNTPCEWLLHFLPTAGSEKAIVDGTKTDKESGRLNNWVAYLVQ